MSEDTVLPIDRAALAVTRKGWEDSLEAYKNVPAASLSNEQWNECLQMAHAAFKQLEGERTELTRPLDRDLKAINREFKTAQAPMVALKELCGAKLGELAEAARVAAEDAKRLQATHAATGTDEQLLDALAARQTAVLATKAPEGARIVRRWVPVVTSPLQVPREYLEVNMKALEQLGRDSQDAPEVMGVSWRLETKAQPTGKY
jgi:hypothetical protein